MNAAANFSSSVAPDEIVSLFGITGLNGDTPATLPLTTSLGGVALNITDSAGTNHPAPLYGAFSSTGQINFLVPGDTAPGLAVRNITLPSGRTMTTAVDVAAVAPGIFTANLTGEGPYAGQVAYVHVDGSQTVADSAVLNSTGNTFVHNPINLNVASDQVFLTLYDLGLRHASALTAAVNGENAPVSYFGAQGSYPGLDQINLAPLPASLAGTGLINIVITANEQAANTVTAVIQ